MTYIPPNPNGQNTMANSSPVVLASNHSAIIIQGYQPAATAFTGVTTVSVLASTSVLGFNVATITLRTFTGTTPTITWKLQSSDDNTNWADLQGINNSTGVVGLSWTQGAALAAGVAGASIDYTIGAYTNIRISVTAISGTSATATFGMAMQSMPYEASPGAIAQGTSTAGAVLSGNPVRVGGSDGTNIQDLSITAKAVQGARGLATQDIKDAGRTAMSFYAVAAAAGATGTETAITLTKSSGTAATTTGVSFVVTSGKTFRITGMSVATRGSATATIQTTTFNLRVNTAGAVVTTSTPIIFSARSATPATASAWDRYVLTIPDGLEIAGNGTLQFGITANSTYTTNAPTCDVNIIGFEY